MPAVINISYGTSNGSHRGFRFLKDILTKYRKQAGLLLRRRQETKETQVIISRAELKQEMFMT